MTHSADLASGASDGARVGGPPSISQQAWRPPNDRWAPEWNAKEVELASMGGIVRDPCTGVGIHSGPCGSARGGHFAAVGRLALRRVEDRC